MADALTPLTSHAVVEFDRYQGYWSLLSLTDCSFIVAGSSVEPDVRTLATFLFGHCITVTVPVRSEMAANGVQSFQLMDANRSTVEALQLLAQPVIASLVSPVNPASVASLSAVRYKAFSGANSRTGLLSA